MLCDPADPPLAARGAEAIVCWLSERPVATGARLAVKHDAVDARDPRGGTLDARRRHASSRCPATASRSTTSPRCGSARRAAARRPLRDEPADRRVRARRRVDERDSRRRHGARRHRLSTRLDRRRTHVLSCGMRVAYREEPCRTALNRVKGMPFAWSLNPYTGCAHRCTFCYVQAFQARAAVPRTTATAVRFASRSTSPRSLREAHSPLLEAGERRDRAATDPYQRAEARYRLTRACIRELGRARTPPFSLITRGPLARPRRRRPRRGGGPCEGARRLLGADARRADPGAPSPARRRRGGGRGRCGSSPTRGSTRGVALAPLLPGLSDHPELLAEVVREARAAGAGGVWADVLYLRPGTREHFLEALSRDWPELLPTYERLYDRAERTCRRPRPTRPGRSCEGWPRELGSATPDAPSRAPGSSRWPSSRHRLPAIVESEARDRERRHRRRQEPGEITV